MEFTDKKLVCSRCGGGFLFSAAEQFFFRQKLYTNEPRVCKSCRSVRQGSGRKSLLETDVICASCGTKTTVPFTPTKGKPCLCRPCMTASHSAAAVNPNGCGKAQKDV
jgi:CxxC-x17-CxxC domain-containing protein